MERKKFIFKIYEKNEKKKQRYDYGKNRKKIYTRYTCTPATTTRENLCIYSQGDEDVSPALGECHGKFSHFYRFSFNGCWTWINPGVYVRVGGETVKWPNLNLIYLRIAQYKTIHSRTQHTAHIWFWHVMYIYLFPWNDERCEMSTWWMLSKVKFWSIECRNEQTNKHIFFFVFIVFMGCRSDSGGVRFGRRKDDQTRSLT